MKDLSTEYRSWLMQRIRSRDTKPELLVRSMLHRAGFRFSLRRKDLPGKPDVVMPKFRTVIFVHGCFWHKHKATQCLKPRPKPKTNTAFWEEKFRANVKRDRDNVAALKKLGWRVLTVWECELQKNPVDVFSRLVGELEEELHVVTSYDTFSTDHVLEATEKRHRRMLRYHTGSDSFSGRKQKS